MSRPAADVDSLPPPEDETLGDAATYWRYRALWAGVARLPERTARRLPHLLGRAWYAAADEARRERVRTHLRRLLDGRAPRETMVRATFESYARYWVEAFRLHRMDPGDVAARCHGEGLQVVDDALRRGGAILATGHVGSWEVGALWTTHRGWPMTVVAEVVEPRRLFDRFVALRRRAGIDVIPLVEGGDMIDRLEGVVADGGLATLLADRDLTRKGPVVSFCGEPCRMPPGTAALARRTGAPVAVGGFLTDGDGWRGVIEGGLLDLSGLDVAVGTQRVADRMEQLLRRDPTQWHVLVRHWLVDREPDHPAVALWREDPAGWAQRWARHRGR